MNTLAFLCLVLGLVNPPQAKPVAKAQAVQAVNRSVGQKATGKKCPQIDADGKTQFVDCNTRTTPPSSKPNATTSADGKHDQRQNEDSPGTLSTINLDSPLGKKYVEAQAASLDYQIEALNHRRSVFRWQHTSSMIIFWLVTALVLAGLALAALQFWEASKAQQAHTEIAAQNARVMAGVAADNSRVLAEARAEALKIAASGVPGGAPAPAAPATAEPPKPDKKDDATSFELSLSGIKISSSVIGLIVLAMSMGFFYLYLKYVYPVQEVGQKPQTEQTQKSTDQAPKK